MQLPIVSTAEMRRIEEAAFSAGVTAADLMEEVGYQIASAVVQVDRRYGIAHIYYGKGNNGGDALAAARHLADSGWQIELHPLEADPAKLSPLAAENLARFLRLESAAELASNPIHDGKLAQRDVDRVDSATKHSQSSWPRPLRPGRTVILDGLLGIGATGPLRGEIRVLTRGINAMRSELNALTFSIDVPTGLNADTGEADPDCVISDYTVAAGFAKTGLVADSAPKYVGRLCVAPLAAFASHAPALSPAVGCGSLNQAAERSSLFIAIGQTATAASLASLLPRRSFDSYKNLFGHIGIVAGSPGFIGAAILCSTGALRGGAGLVTIYAPEEIAALVAAKASPEIMVHPVKSYEEVLERKHDVLAVGPGLGKERAGAILQLVECAACPMVLDADGLNIVATHGPALLARCAGPRLLTPHPGEMARLFPDFKQCTRLEAATRFTGQFADASYPITLLLKGSRTLVHQHGRPASYNTTGNPGMSTGGMGDVLTGVCAALMGQHLEPYDAARVGAWLCGQAADVAARARSEESLAAMDVPEFLGAAFQQLRSRSL